MYVLASVVAAIQPATEEATQSIDKMPTFLIHTCLVLALFLALYGLVRFTIPIIYCFRDYYPPDWVDDFDDSPSGYLIKSAIGLTAITHLVYACAFSDVGFLSGLGYCLAVTAIILVAVAIIGLVIGLLFFLIIDPILYWFS